MTRFVDPQALALLVALDSGAPSIGAAARAVGMAQPNASRLMRNLEADVRLDLVERTAQGTTLTSEGRALAARAEAVLDDYAGFDHVARSLADARASRIHVCASLTVADHLLPAWMTGFRARHAEVSVGLTVENSQAVIDHVREHRCDLGFVESVEVPRVVTARTVSRDALVVAASPAFADAWSTPIDAAGLAEVPLLVREKGSGTRGVIDRALAAHGGARVAAEFTSAAALKVAAAAGLAPVAMSRLAMRRELDTGRFRELPVDASVSLERPIRVIWSADTRMSPGARDFLEYVADPTGRTTSAPHASQEGRS